MKSPITDSFFEFPSKYAAKISGDLIVINGLVSSIPNSTKTSILGLKSLSQAHGSRALYWTISSGGMPYVTHDLLGIILGVSNLLDSGSVNLETATA